MYTILLALLSLLSAPCDLDHLQPRTGSCTIGADTLVVYPGSETWGYDLVQSSQTVQGDIRWDIHGRATLAPTDSMSAAEWAEDVDAPGLPACNVDRVYLPSRVDLLVCTVGNDTLQLERDPYGVLYTLTRTPANGPRLLEFGALIHVDGRPVFDVSDWCARDTWKFGAHERRQMSLPAAQPVQLAARNVSTEPERATTCYLDLSCP